MTFISAFVLLLGTYNQPMSYIFQWDIIYSEVYFMYLIPKLLFIVKLFGKTGQENSKREYVDVAKHI